MKVLDHEQIKQKIKRLAIEIVEQNYDEEELFLGGINNNGMHFARLLLEELEKIGHVTYHLIQVRLNPANPIADPVELELDLNSLNDKVIILVDDVANTGRTIFYATKPLLSILPKRVEAAVLVDRQHKAFPIRVDHVGLSLATTLKENIEVDISDPKDYAVYLK